MSGGTSRMHWTVAVVVGLRKSTRPGFGLENILTPEERDEMDLRYAMGWTAQEFVELLSSRDTQAADRVRSTARNVG